MKSIMRLLHVIILFSLTGILYSQEIIEEQDQVYGLDPLLYNGKKYTYFLPPGTGGNQFLNSPDYYLGQLVIKGIPFKDITLNYDIFNQQLLLRYADDKGSFNIIEISKAWLENFHLGDLYFELHDFGDGNRFYQVLGEGQARILYYYRKELKLDVLARSGTYEFSPAIKSSYVLKKDKLYPFGSKHSLLRVFGKEYKQDIKSYMRKNRIRTKNVSDAQMKELINFISNLIPEK